MTALTTMAWNSYVNDKPQKILRWNGQTIPAIADFDKAAFLEGVDVL